MSPSKLLSSDLELMFAFPMLGIAEEVRRNDAREKKKNDRFRNPAVHMVQQCTIENQRLLMFICYCGRQSYETKEKESQHPD